LALYRSLSFMQNERNLCQVSIKTLSKFGSKVSKDFLNSTFQSRLNFDLFCLGNEQNLSARMKFAVTYLPRKKVLEYLPQII